MIRVRAFAVVVAAGTQLIGGQGLAQNTPAPTSPLPNAGGRADIGARGDPVRPITANQTFQPDRDTPQTMQSYAMMISFGRCAASIGKGAVTRALGQAPESPSERQITDVGVGLGGCNPQPVRIKSLIRGSLAEGVYHKAIKNPPSGVTDPARLESFLDEEAKFNALRDKSDQAMAQVTSCLAASQPETADKVLASRHGSNEEAVVMDSLFHNSPACGRERPKNLSRSFLRAFLAESLYRYSLFAGDRKS